MSLSQYSLIPEGFFADDFAPMIRRMRRAIDSVVRDAWEPGQILSEVSRGFEPRVSVSEDEREVRVQAELPGMCESDIEVTYEPGYLILKGEKKEEAQRESKVRGARYSEWRYGAFERRVPLRVDIQEGQIQASFDRGVLTVCLPKTEQGRLQTRKIPVKLGAPPQLETSTIKGRETPSQGAQSAH
jgi:HSP20 family protein